jgi:hypothetical protein
MMHSGAATSSSCSSCCRSHGNGVIPVSKEDIAIDQKMMRKSECKWYEAVNALLAEQNMDMTVDMGMDTLKTSINSETNAGSSSVPDLTNDDPILNRRHISKDLFAIDTMIPSFASLSLIAIVGFVAGYALALAKCKAK